MQTNVNRQQARSQGGGAMWAMAPPNSKSYTNNFQLIKFSCVSQRNISVQINETA